MECGSAVPAEEARSERLWEHASIMLSRAKRPPERREIPLCARNDRKISAFRSWVWALLAVAAVLAQSVQAKPTQQEFSREDFYARFGVPEEKIDYESAIYYLLDLVNNDREENGLGTVELDNLALQAAEEHATDMIENDYFSHWDRSGKKPTERYNDLGGMDPVSENIALRKGTLPFYLTKKLIEDLEKGWMESPGHRKNILNPLHTHVGLAIRVNKIDDLYTVTACQEFVDRYGSDYSSPREAKIGQEVPVKGKLGVEKVQLAYIAVAKEPLPAPLTSEDLKSFGESYSDPVPTSGYLLKSASASYFEDLKTFHSFDYNQSTGAFSGNVTADEGEGLYYIYVIVKGKDGEQFPAAVMTVAVSGEEATQKEEESQDLPILEKHT